MIIDKLEPFLGDTYQSRPDFEILKYLIKEKKTCFWMTGRLYVMPTYEQKLIWIQM